MTAERIAEIKERAVGSPRSYDIFALIDALEASQAEFAAYREALKRYGRHLRDDMDREYCTSVKCACGFDAALNPPAGEPKS